MTGKIDFQRIAAAIDVASAVQGWLPSGKRVGSEWVAINPTRADSRAGSFSINLATGAWADFATSDEGGDVISLFAYLFHNGDQVNAAQELAGTYRIDAAPQSGHAPTGNVGKIDAARPVVVMPVPDGAPKPNFNHPTHGQASRKFPYYDADGRLMFLVCRFDPPEGRKQICPLSWCDHLGKPSRWTWAGIRGDQRRPLYGLDRIAALPDADVIVCEGEKTADAAQAIVGREFACVAWLGGTATADRVDVAPLIGRRVWLWPDQDLQRKKLSSAEVAAGADPDAAPILDFHEQTGPRAMLEIARALVGRASQIMLVGYNPHRPKFPHGWDLADAQSWGVDNVRGFLATHGGDWRDIAAHADTAEAEPDPAPAADLAPQPSAQPVAANDNRAKPLDVDLNPYGWPHTTEKGAPQNTVENLAHLLREYGIAVTYDVISKNIAIDIPGRKFGQDNRAANSLATITSLCVRNRMPQNNLADYIGLIADSNPINPAADFITAREWDGVDRIPDLVKTLDPADPRLAAILLRRWMIGAVACAMSEDGFAMQGVLVLQGAQNAGKTTWLWTLAGGRRAGLMLEGAQLDPSNKDSVKEVISRWLVELGELDATFRKADIAALKAFVTRDRDAIRLPYARASSEFARRTAFAATVNEKGYLRDDTGNRRFWSIEVGGNLRGVHDIDVQQCWAQIAAEWRAGEPHRLSREELAALERVNEDFAETSPIEEQLRSKFDWGDLWRPSPMTATQALIAVGYDRPDKRLAREAGVILRKLTGGEPRKLNGNMVFDMPPRTGEWPSAGAGYSEDDFKR